MMLEAKVNKGGESQKIRNLIKFSDVFVGLFATIAVCNQLYFIEVLDTPELTLDIQFLWQNVRVFFSIEYCISVVFSIDFFLKLFLHFIYGIDATYPTFYLYFDLLAGPTSLIHDILYFNLIGQFSSFGIMMRFLKLFTLKGTRNLFEKLKNLFTKIYKIFFSIFSIFYLFTYLSKAFFNNDLPQYFGTLGTSFFTMFQIFTLDGWGDIARSIIQTKGYIYGVFLCLFVFLMTYFFLNFILGIIVDHLNETVTSCLVEGNEKRTFKQELVYSGPRYDKLVLCYLLMSMLEIYTYVTSSDYPHKMKLLVRTGAILFETSCGILFTFHSIYLLKRFLAKGYSEPFLGIYLVFHLVSGPIATFVDMYQFYFYSYIKIGPFLRIFKILTTADNKKVINKSINMLPSLAPPFILLIVTMISLAWYTTERYRYILPNFFGSFNDSLFSLYQIITQDDWCANISRKLIAQDLRWAPIMFMVFILVANYLIMNVMAAIACLHLASSSDQQPKPASYEELSISEHKDELDFHHLCERISQRFESDQTSKFDEILDTLSRMKAYFKDVPHITEEESKLIHHMKTLKEVNKAENKKKNEFGKLLQELKKIPSDMSNPAFLAVNQLLREGNSEVPIRLEYQDQSETFCLDDLFVNPMLSEHRVF
eukprot:TRINITY_DN4877_c0_g2_i1.p1 TRINITY_DN4877_c0_g2~~TRINITY_DN4877_c0_g2_i1.p1  ORF type:complete len:652 (-),score=82.47 TRINITY_DN4877_c0_g2_i1:33-1988(-)